MSKYALMTKETKTIICKGSEKSMYLVKKALDLRNKLMVKEIKC